MHDPTKLNIPRGSIQGGVRSLDPMAWNRVQKASKAGTHYTERRTKGRGYWTTKRDGEVQLRLEQDSLENEAPLTIHDVILSTATRFGNYLALCSKYKDAWYVLNYIEYYEECRCAAKAFLKLGLERFHGVGIMGSNSAEWVISSIGAMMAGGISVGMAPSHSAKACQAVAEKAEIDIFVVDSDKQLQKVIQMQHHLKHLKAIVQYKELLQTSQQQNLYSWKGFLDLAIGVSDEKLDQVIDAQKPNQCCTLVYSLGVTGPPRVMMLSHDNITWTAAAVVQSLPYKCPPEGQEVLVSYLPLSHIGAQIFEMWVAILVAGTLYFGPPETGKMTELPRPPGTGFLIELMREVQPTTFYGIPWMWYWMLDMVKTSQLESTRLRRRIDDWAMKMGLDTNQKRMFGRAHPPLFFGLAKKLVFNRTRKSLGLNNCQQFFNLGLGLPKATLDFFLSLNIPICELYGLSECTGVHTVSSNRSFRLLSCGKELPNTHTKVEEENEDSIGNIYIWGRNIFMGYLSDHEDTRKMIDNQGWMHTGDLGFLDTDNFLYIMGSLKDMITLSSGEVINPTPIEERVKMHIPLVHYAVVVGQDSPYLCALLTMKCQVNWETGEPRGVLTSEAVAFCRSINSQSTWLTDVLNNQDPIINEFIEEGMKAVNEEAPSEGAKIVKWFILDTDFSVGSGELGVTTNLKRAIVTKMYQEEIQAFYTEKQQSQ
ncbi:long-chain-fatty-acid--CoA ligase ACSBG2-like [Castor canadensis]|uniref:Long-chain-fatty-acid--CoA ligase ACSBG2-like n=1 Tax=Castor canadensis TaxID=51338 RepID=A0AC58L054_CASCN